MGGVAQLGERLLCKQNVASSILVTSTILGRLAQLVRASALQAEGHWFDPSTFHQVSNKVLFRTSKHGVGGGLLIHEGWFDSNVRSHF